MRLIAVLGVIFVLASCSDSDMKENFDSDIPDNFGVSCSLGNEKDKSFRAFFEFDFDKNIINYKIQFPTTEKISEIDEEYPITEISASTIVFGKTNNDIKSSYIYTFDRASFMIRSNYSFKDTPWGDKFYSNVYKCELPKI